MRKLTKYKPLFRGLTATMASILALSTAGYAVADTWRGNVDDILETQSYVMETSANPEYTSEYTKVDDLIAAARQVAVREGEEGTVIMKNDGNALPLSTTGNPKAIVLGAAGYSTYPYNGSLKAANADALFMDDAIRAAGFDVNQKLADIYDGENGILSKTEAGPPGWGGRPTTVYPYRPSSAPGDGFEEDGEFKVTEVDVDRLGTLAGTDSSWKDEVDNNTIAFVVLCRPGGEGSTYKPGAVKNLDGEVLNQDPLSITPDEMSLIEYANLNAGKTIVLLNTANAMEINDIVTGENAVDAIAYIGCPNDYQCEGIMNVLTGKVNSTGALADTFVVNNESAPAVQNWGGGSFTDAADIGSTANSPYGRDSRWGDQDVLSAMAGSFGGDGETYSGSDYIVEAEGIYVGYNYYETRYYDSVVDAAGTKANSTAGSSNGNAWSYAAEVVYPFGHGLSLLDYTQKLTNVEVDESVTGNVVATVEITNDSSTTAGKFLAQLYVQTPYTEYDKTNKVEKSAIQFLNSAKVDLAAGETKTVTISVPTKYLASYDYTNAKTYILDGGTYYFAIGAGAHEAVNNVLAAQGKTTTDGMDKAGDTACVQTWANGATTETDTSTFSTSATGTKITNVADSADMNYWIEGAVTYLSRSDWESTWPKNYNEAANAFAIASSSKASEWVKEIRGQQYEIKTNEPATEGGNNGYSFTRDQITQTQIDDITDPFWDNLVAQITIDQAVGGVIHGGNRTDVSSYVNNPIVTQNEGVNGFSGSYRFTEADNSAWAAANNNAASYKFNVNSQTLLGTSFNPELAYEWGKIEGESGIWLQRYAVWGIGLTQRRTVYNGRNYEYISEDAMLTNRIAERFTVATREKGILCGAKHAGFNDQEHNRSGIAIYMNEQKFRETDLRGFQGAMEDGKAMAVMIAFNRIGPVNASHHVGMLKTMFRDEWGFKGLMSTDMMNNCYYFYPEAMVMATITQVADFGGGDNSISEGGEGGVDAVWSYISVRSVRNDATLVDQARQNLKYQLYAFANSAVIDSLTVPVTPWWETMFGTIIGVSAGLTILAAAAYVTTKVLEILPEKKEEN